MTLRVHPFPYRTRKLSSMVPKILDWWRSGKIGRCQHKWSSIAQSVERMTVNHDVTGSSPVGGASAEPAQLISRLIFVGRDFFFLTLKNYFLLYRPQPFWIIIQDGCFFILCLCSLLRKSCCQGLFWTAFCRLWGLPDKNHKRTAEDILGHSIIIAIQ